jgi:hypothetical protein
MFKHSSRTGSETSVEQRSKHCKACSATRQGQRASLGIPWPDRTAELIRCNAIGDSRHRLSESMTRRAAINTCTAGLWDQSCPRPPRAEPWRSDISELRCAYFGVTSGGRIPCAGRGSCAVKSASSRLIEQGSFESVAGAELGMYKQTQGRSLQSHQTQSLAKCLSLFRVGTLRYPQADQAARLCRRSHSRPYPVLPTKLTVQQYPRSAIDPVPTRSCSDVGLRVIRMRAR